jgi:hypothetical protein
MNEDKKAALYTSPGGKFIKEDTLPRILAHWRSFRSEQRRKHFDAFRENFERLKAERLAREKKS